MLKELRRLTLVALLLAAALVPARRIAQAQAPDAAVVAFRLLVVSAVEEAQRLRAQIVAGGSFAELSRERSIDPSAARGGLIGPIEPALLRPELRAALAALAGAEVSPVIPVPTGFAIVQRAEVPSGSSMRGSEIPAIAAVGGVKYTVSVDGFAEANTALEGIPKPDNWNQDPLAICEYRKQSIAGVKTALGRILGAGAAQPRDYTMLEIVQAHVAYGQLFAYDGHMAETIVQFEQAHRLAVQHVPEAVPDLQQMLAVAHLHKAEMDNGIYHAPGDRCLLSMRAGAPLAKREDFDKAVALLTGLLEAAPQDVETKWLLNAAHIATGGYPDRVPERFRIDASAFESAESLGRFTDVSSVAGVDSFSAAGGVVVDDFDNDGILDIFTSNFESCGQPHLFRRTAAGPFAEVATQAGLRDQLGGLNLVQADFDNDGCRDVLMLRGGWELAQRKSMLRNTCKGTFVDVTAASGLALPVTSTQTAVWVDIDNDGWLDLFVGNEDSPSQLFRNRGNGTFEDIAPAAGVARSGFTKAVAAADYDNDGDVDLYVSNLGGGNYLYRNNGNRTFAEVAAQAGVPGADRGFPAWFFDYDNDGWDDLLVSSYYLSVEESARAYLRLPQNATTMKLYRNRGDGTFADVSVEAKLARTYMPMGSNFGDLDNDGFLDIYLGTGSPSYAALVPSVLLRNQDGRSFADVTAASGTGELHKGHGVAMADLDNDGDLEIVFKAGGATRGDAHAFRLFENPGHGNDWLKLELVGAKSNRDGIGARIIVGVENAGRRRTIHRTVNSGGSFGASPLQQHVGLGRDARNVTVDVWWPASNTRQRFTGITRNTVIQVREDANTIRTLDRRPMPLTARGAADARSSRR